MTTTTIETQMSKEDMDYETNMSWYMNNYTHVNSGKNEDELLQDNWWDYFNKKHSIECYV